MGDRANVHIKNGDDDVFLYSHNRGSELPIVLRNALQRRQRWDDGQYLSRIIFCTMVRGDVEGEIGFGISSKVKDGADRVLIVDVEQQSISIGAAKTWTFEEYASLVDEQCGWNWEN